VIAIKRILFVDDSPLDTELALEALGRAHLANEVVAVRDGAEALDYLRRRGSFSGRSEGNPAVVLLDLKMPKVDGTEVMREMRSDAGLKMIPIIVMTSSREHKDLLESYQLGANAYVVKPVSFHDFVAAMKDVGYFWGVLNEPPPGTAPRGAKDPTGLV
jgi:CheY-like chemotaxis protein